MSRNKLLFFLILLSAAVFLFFSLRGIEWSVVGRTVVSIKLAYAAVSLVLGFLPMLLRAGRWRVLLQAQAPVSFKTSFWAVAAGYFGNNFLPARGGELVRSFVVRRHTRLDVSYVLATALSERVADAVALVFIGAVILIFLPQAGAWMNAARTTFAAISLIGILLLAGLPVFEYPATRFLAKWPRIQAAVQQMLLGVRSLHQGQRFLSFVALTAAIWSLDALATATLAQALSIRMPVFVAMLLIVALSLSSALPGAPGYIGVYQFVAVTVLKPFGISPSSAIAFILVTQALNYTLTTVLGILAMTCFTPFNGRSFRDLLQPIQTQS